jgi:hypothetical protein
MEAIEHYRFFDACQVPVNPALAVDAAGGDNG